MVVHKYFYGRIKCKPSKCKVVQKQNISSNALEQNKFSNLCDYFRNFILFKFNLK